VERRKRRKQKLKRLILAASTAGNMRRKTIAIAFMSLRHLLTTMMGKSLEKEQVAILPYPWVGTSLMPHLRMTHSTGCTK
jgi:hypothetical protein